MDTVETEYKAKIKELEKRDPTEQLKEVVEEVVGKIVHQIANMTHLLETTTESRMGIEQINIVEEVCEKIRQAEAEITRSKEETPSLTLVQRIMQLGKSKKL